MTFNVDRPKVLDHVFGSPPQQSLTLMKYKFSGDNDVPEWLLAEVSTLSKISCVRLKLITRAVINELSGGVLDVEKVTKLVPPNITWSDIKAVLAAISFILRGAVRNAVDEGA